LLGLAQVFDGPCRVPSLEPGAAWKLYGKALTEAGESGAAIEAYRQGIAVAERRGDRQAAKEMAVFLRRLEKSNQ
jgi:hypothetical protein